MPHGSTDKIQYLASLNQKIQEGGILKSLIPLVWVGHVQPLIKVCWSPKGFYVQNFSEKCVLSKFFEMLQFGNSSVVPDLECVPVVLRLSERCNGRVLVHLRVTRVLLARFGSWRVNLRQDFDMTRYLRLAGAWEDILRLGHRKRVCGSLQVIQLAENTGSIVIYTRSLLYLSLEKEMKKSFGKAETKRCS